MIEAEKPALRGVTDVRAAGELSDAIWSPRCVRRHVDRRLLTPLRPSPVCRAQSTCSIVAVRLALTNAVRAPAI